MYLCHRSYTIEQVALFGLCLYPKQCQSAREVAWKLMLFLRILFHTTISWKYLLCDCQTTRGKLLWLVWNLNTIRLPVCTRIIQMLLQVHFTCNWVRRSIPGQDNVNIPGALPESDPWACCSRRIFLFLWIRLLVGLFLLRLWFFIFGRRGWGIQNWKGGIGEEFKGGLEEMAKWTWVTVLLLKNLV